MSDLPNTPPEAQITVPCEGCGKDLGVLSLFPSPVYWIENPRIACSKACIQKWEAFMKEQVS